jgi:glycerophosphoryl diester phosphodiesterase
VTTIELDLGLTRDGVAVVSHDPCLNCDLTRGPDGCWVDGPGLANASLSYGELARYDVGRLRPGSAAAAAFPHQVPCDGARIPKLADVFALARRAGNREVRFNLEIKTSPLRPDETASPDAIADAVVRVVREAGLAARSTIQSFDWRGVLRVRETAVDLRTACLTSQQPDDDTVDAERPGPKPWLAGLDPSAVGGSVPRLVQAAGSRVWSPDFRDLTAPRLAEAHGLGLEVVVWTVDEPEDMARLIDMGVDGIITDHTDRLRALMVARGMPVPKPTPVVP